MLVVSKGGNLKARRYRRWSEITEGGHSGYVKSHTIMQMILQDLLTASPIHCSAMS
jgi:hypothetical protein